MRTKTTRADRSRRLIYLLNVAQRRVQRFVVAQSPKGVTAAQAGLLFVLGQRDCVTRIRGCLEQADRTSAHRLAHTLKGTAGQIGARKLRALAETLEAALRGGTPAADLELMLADAGGELAVSKAVTVE